MGKILVSMASIIISKIFTEKILIKILIKLGDFLVKKTTNDLDDKVWGEVKKALEEPEGK